VLHSITCLKTGQFTACLTWLWSSICVFCVNTARDVVTVLPIFAIYLSLYLHVFLSRRTQETVLLGFIKPILENHYSPGVFLRASQGVRTHDGESSTYLITLSSLRQPRGGGSPPSTLNVHSALGNQDRGVQLVDEGTCCLAWGFDFDRRRDRGVACVLSVLNVHGSVCGCRCVYTHTHNYCTCGVLRRETMGRDETPGGIRESRWTKSRLICIRIWVQNAHSYVYARSVGLECA